MLHARVSLTRACIYARLPLSGGRGKSPGKMEEMGMFREDFTMAGKSALAKYRLLKDNPAGYVAAAFLAGFYIGLGGIIMGITGSLLSGQPA